MTSFVIGPATEFPEDEVRVAAAGKHSIAVVRRGESVFAVANRCPHMGAKMCTGWLRGRLDGAGVGRVATRPDVPVLACPWHGWEFDLATGESLFDADYRVKTYRAEIVDGDVVVEIGRTRD